MPIIRLPIPFQLYPGVASLRRTEIPGLTLWPALRSAMAEASPHTPAPTTMMSSSRLLGAMLVCCKEILLQAASQSVVVEIVHGASHRHDITKPIAQSVVNSFHICRGAVHSERAERRKRVSARTKQDTPRSGVTAISFEVLRRSLLRLTSPGTAPWDLCETHTIPYRIFVFHHDICGVFARTMATNPARTM